MRAPSTSAARRRPVPQWPEGWAGPWWVQRAAGPTWTLLGDLAAPARLAVDPGGSLWVPGLGWSVDWWVGADDRWHVPAREPSVGQALVDDAPVVQTTVRVPSGVLHQRVVVVPGPGGPEAVVSVVNDSAAPLALALVVRPLTLVGAGRIDRVALAGRSLVVDGLEALRLPERPRRARLGTGTSADPLAQVMAGEVPEAVDAEAACPDGLAWAVVIVPVAHRATWTCRLLLQPARPAPAAPPRPVPVDVASAARGWRAQVDRRTRLELPADRVTAALDAVRAHLLLAAGADLPGAAGCEVAVAAATAGLGLADPTLVLGRAATVRRPGAGTAGAALWAAERLTRLGAPGPDTRLVAGVAQALVRRGATRGPAASSPAWVAAGAAAAAQLLAAAGEAGASGTALGWCREALAGLEGDDAVLAAVLGAGAPVAVAGSPLLLPPAAGHPDPAVVDPARTLLWASADLVAGGAHWYDRLSAVAGLASPTWCWPDRCAPGRPGGCGALGEDPLAVARLWAALRSGLVAAARGAATASLAVLPGWPAHWAGQGLEVHGLPTSVGSVSFALRWHGDRPALLWSVDGAPPDLAVRAPGLDRSWRAAGPRGEALLAPLVGRSAPGVL